jgi:adenine-specific DNA-methyltransferase
LDPPYNNRQYGANYCPLNFIAKYGENLVINDNTKTGLLKNYNKSKYCQKISAINMFDELISKLNSKHILLSYNNEGIMNIEDIKTILTKNGRTILYKKIYKKYKSNIKQNDEVVYEYLFYLKRSNNHSYKEIIIDNNNNVVD